MTNYHLAARPIVIEGESPASVLIRAVEGNGYPNLQSLIWAYWGMKSARSWIKSTIVDPDRYLQIMEAFGIKSPDGQVPSFHRHGPTKESPRILDGQLYQEKLFRDDVRYFCPECLKENQYWRKSWSLRPFSVCPKHNLLLIKDCHECGATLQPWRGKLAKCECGANLAEAKSKSADYGPLQWWLNIHNESDELAKLVEELFFALSLIDGGELEPLQEHQRLQATQAWLESTKIVPWLLDLINQRSGELHPRLQLLSLLGSTYPEIKAMCNAILTQCEHKTMDDVSTQDSWMSYRDARFALGISAAHLRKIMKHNMLDFKDGRVAKRGQVSRMAANQLLYKLQVSDIDVSSTEKRPLTCSLASLIDDILNGNKIGGGYDITLGLISLRFKRKSVASQLLDYDNDWVGIEQIAEMLGTYPEAVRFACKKGLIDHKNRDLNGRKRLIAKRTVVDEFNRKFVLAGTFAKQINENPTNLAEKLMAMGFNAVSGPRIDGALVYLFKRADIEKVDLNKLRMMGQYSTNAGRKVKQKNTNSENPVEMSAAEAANKLNIRPEDVHILLRKKLLQRSDRNDRKIYVTKNSVEELVSKVNNIEYISLEDAAQRLNQSVRSVQSMWGNSGALNIMELGLWRKVSIKEMESLEKMLESHVTSAQAGKMMSMHRSYLPNLEREGKVHPILFGSKKTIKFYEKIDIQQLAGKPPNY